MRRLFLLSTVIAALVSSTGSTEAATHAVGSSEEQALSQAQIRKDFDLAIAMVEAGLPDLYWNQTRREWRQDKARAVRQLRDARNARDLYRVLAPLLSRIGEGHMSLRRSEAIIVADRADGLFFRLDVHFSTEGLFVISGYGDAADLPRGTEILAIDDQVPSAIVRDLMTVRFHDGDIATEVMRTASGRGYAAYRHRLSGNTSAFHLRLRASDGQRFDRIVHAVPTSARPRLEEAADAPLPTLEWVDGATAVVTVPTFSNRRLRAVNAIFPAAIRTIFEEVVARGAKDMVLDLRDNGGGSEPNEAILFSHLVAEPLQRYAAVEARGASVSVTDNSGRRYTKIVFDPEELATQ